MPSFRSFLESLINNGRRNSLNHKNLRTKNRTCRIEELESREMLSVTPWSLVEDFSSSEPQSLDCVVLAQSKDCGSVNVPALAPLAAAPDLNPLATTLSQEEFDYLREEKYADLELSATMTDYNVMVITADQLSDKNLRDAIEEASTNDLNNLIVVRTTETQNKIMLGGTELSINSGNVMIVSLGAEMMETISRVYSALFLPLA